MFHFSPFRVMNYRETVIPRQTRLTQNYLRQGENVQAVFTDRLNPRLTQQSS